MDKKIATKFINEKIVPKVGAFANEPHLTALRDGMSLTMPLIIIGSLFLIISNFPINGYLTFMANTFGKNWTSVPTMVTNATFNLMGIVADVGIAYQMAKYRKVDPITASIIAFAAFILTIPLTTSKGIVSIPLGPLGSSGLFTAIIVGLGITELYCYLVRKKFTIKMPSTVPPAVSNSFSALLPGSVVLIIVWVFTLLINMTPYKTIPNMISALIAKPLSGMGTSFWGAFIAELLVSLLWICGIHGANVVNVLQPIWLSAMAQNAAAMAKGKTLPYIVTQQFFDQFVRLGGCGATLSLAILILFMAKSANLKSLGKLITGPSLFNINEPVIFGVPIVMNFMLAIPFIVAPLMNVILAYLSMKFGVVHKPIGVSVPFTTPILLSGFLATGSISGAVLQFVEVIVDGLIYYPFLKLFDKHNTEFN
ncbi:PTS sugar transporter subunit IIC [Lactiplantibacillus plantarum]|uniref:PTS sugar transporter subunit IIC n=1 Tax=Lactiplantibacillus plantarum TaxID=1590 RepID=UPI001E41DE2F|nr:PTS sugar transporter subunit IIC [Lactiplantibacillus plantarum]MCC6117925.1 PTS sugar transporter subunit IIC [Lactiplantibacillus plantarum]MCW6115472.1 PTS sugar transporter subunit IIC [Lactiplantibacillus plantarum]